MYLSVRLLVKLMLFGLLGSTYGRVSDLLELFGVIGATNVVYKARLCLTRM